jgi:hypothetical protein
MNSVYKVNTSSSRTLSEKFSFNYRQPRSVHKLHRSPTQRTHSDTHSDKTKRQLQVRSRVPAQATADKSSHVWEHHSLLSHPPPAGKYTLPSTSRRYHATLFQALLPINYTNLCASEHCHASHMFFFLNRGLINIFMTQIHLNYT